MSPDRYHNIPELADLSDGERSALDLGVDAIAALKKTFDHWLVIAHGVAIIRKQADRRGGKKTFHRLLQRAGYGVLVDKSRSSLTRLVQIAAREDEVRRWRDTLTEAQRWDWASPSAIFKHCPLFAKGGKGKQPPAFKAIRFEVALDAVLDHLHAMDIDNRRAVIERITGPFRQELGADVAELEAARESVVIAGNEKDASATSIEQAKTLLVAALKGRSNYQRARVMIDIINAINGDYVLMYRLNDEELLAQGKIMSLRFMGPMPNEFVPEGDAAADPAALKAKPAPKRKRRKPTKKRATSKGDAAAQQAAAPKAKRKPTTALVWTDGNLSTATVGGGEEYAIRKSLLFDIFGDRDNETIFSVYFGRFDVPLDDRRKVGKAATLDEAKDIAQRHNAAKG
jgi:hypothetical protein